MTPASKTTFIAYEVGDAIDMPVQPAPTARQWMDDADYRHPYRCLPLVMANQAGWIIPCPLRFTARWNGGPRPQDLRIWFPRGKKETRIVSHFGNGVLTFKLPYLFRTPRGVNLWVKGAANWIKDGVQPLEGIVETDWSISTFTMNWKMTRPHHKIRFDQGEPICLIVPVSRKLAESLQPRRTPLAENPSLEEQFRTWSAGRNEFNQGLAQVDEEAVRRGWQKDYVLGLDMHGRQFQPHQTRLHIKPFAPAK